MLTYKTFLCHLLLNKSSPFLMTIGTVMTDIPMEKVHSELLTEHYSMHTHLFLNCFRFSENTNRIEKKRQQDKKTKLINLSVFRKSSLRGNVFTLKIENI